MIITVVALKRRQTFAINEDLLMELEEFRWRNRIPSLSKALEQLLRKAISEKGESRNLAREGRREYESRINNGVYREMKLELERKRSGAFVVIALGRLQGSAATLEGAFQLLRSKAPRARHAIIQKIGERIETESVWEGIGERVS